MDPATNELLLCYLVRSAQIIRGEVVFPRATPIRIVAVYCKRSFDRVGQLGLEPVRYYSEYEQLWLSLSDLFSGQVHAVAVMPGSEELSAVQNIAGDMKHRIAVTPLGELPKRCSLAPVRSADKFFAPVGSP